MMEKEIRKADSDVKLQPSSDDGGFDFSKAAIQPVRPEPRYSLNMETLGLIERLAKAQFILSEKAPDINPTKFEKTDADTLRSIALSVFASSEIEGEGISTDYIEAFVMAHTEPGEMVDGDLRQRIQAHHDIIDSYFWALNSTREPVLTYDFVLEAHERMFRKTKGGLAGRIKDRDVRIRWYRRDGKLVEVPTAPAAQSEEFLRALCERTNKQFKLSADSAETPMLLVAAEFMCDFLAIHPFSDGNGRAARLLTTYLLERGGYHFSRIYPLDQVVLDSRSDYYEALNTSQRYWHRPQEDLTPWINYFVGTVFEQWERAFRRIRNHTRSK